MQQRRAVTQQKIDLQEILSRLDLPLAYECKLCSVSKRLQEAKIDVKNEHYEVEVHRWDFSILQAYKGQPWL